MPTLALQRALAAHLPQMRAAAQRICRHQQDAEDAVQDACLAAVEKLGQLRDDGSLGAWLYRITCNAALLVLRRRRHHDRHDALALEPVDPAPPPDERCHHRRELLRVQARSTRLSPLLLDTLLLREVAGLTGPEVAARLGVTEEVVKTRIHRARGLLAGSLSREASPP